MTYCGWTKSCITLDGWNLINNDGINHLLTGAGFLPSTVSCHITWHDIIASSAGGYGANRIRVALMIVNGLGSTLTWSREPHVVYSNAFSNTGGIQKVCKCPFLDQSLSHVKAVQKTSKNTPNKRLNDASLGPLRGFKPKWSQVVSGSTSCTRGCGWTSGFCLDPSRQTWKRELQPHHTVACRFWKSTPAYLPVFCMCSPN